MDTTYHRRGLFFPLILVALGVFFLLNNLGVLPGDFWSLLARYWPVLFIIAGLDDIYRGGNPVGAFFWIGLGIIFMAANLGFLGISIWPFVLRFWPVLIIVGGVQVLLSRYSRQAWAMALGLIIAVLLLGGMVWYSVAGQPVGTPLGSDRIAQPLGNATRGDVRISPASGAIRIHSQPDNAMLAIGNVGTSRFERVESSGATQNGLATFELRGPGVGQPLAISGNTNSPTWDIGLTNAIPLDIQVDLGAGDVQVDLSGLLVSEVKVNAGVGQTTLQLPSRGGFSGTVSQAIGQVLVIVPKGAPVQINADTAISAVNAPVGFTKNGKAYTSPGFDPGVEHITVNVNLAIGNVEIRER